MPLTALAPKLSGSERGLRSFSDVRKLKHGPVVVVWNAGYKVFAVTLEISLVRPTDLQEIFLEVPEAPADMLALFQAEFAGVLLSESSIWHLSVTEAALADGRLFKLSWWRDSW